MTIRYIKTACTLAFVGGVMFPSWAGAQILETETARPLRAGQLEVGAGYEFQHSREGDEIAIPFAFELGVTSRPGLLVEPVPYTAIRPELGRSATGPGDLEITVSYLLQNVPGSQSYTDLFPSAQLKYSLSSRTDARLKSSVQLPTTDWG
ncbi:MAG: hypothetical protein ABI408_13710 [Gemmatimonadaceae bacterium]